MYLSKLLWSTEDAWGTPCPFLKVFDFVEIFQFSKEGLLNLELVDIIAVGCVTRSMYSLFCFAFNKLFPPRWTTIDCFWDTRLIFLSTESFFLVRYSVILFSFFAYLSRFWLNFDLLDCLFLLLLLCRLKFRERLEDHLTSFISSFDAFWLCLSASRDVSWDEDSALVIGELCGRVLSLDSFVWRFWWVEE